VCLSSIIIADTFELQRRGYAEAFIVIVFAICTSVGPVIGGAISDRIGWRWLYRVQMPCALIGLVGSLCFLPNSNVHTSPDVWREVRRINIPGVVAFVGGTTAMYVAFDHGSNYSWADPTAYATLIAAVLLFAAFVISEKRHPNPYIPKIVLRNRSLVISCLLNLLAFAAELSVLYYLILYWQAVRGCSVIRSSLLALPFTVAGALGGLVTTLWFRYLKEFKKLLLIGGLVGNLGMLSLVFVTHFAKWGSIPGVSVSIFVSELGLTCIVIAATVVLSECEHPFGPPVIRADRV
jgi:predicted MFS family arabinose efflux permease